jgi:PBSX family phage terminase large subunit
MEAMEAKEREILLSGGIGTGKSFVGANWVLNKVIANPGCSAFIGACTYSQLMGASVKTFTTLLDELGIPYTATLSGARKRIEIGQSHIYLYSLDKPDTIRGIEVSFAWLDEIGFSTLEALQVVRGRLRGKNTSYRQMLLTSSPNGFNFLYDQFGNAQDTNKKLIKAKTEENIFLPDGYYDSLLEMYGGENSPLARQELFGEFVNLQEGAIYNLFNRGINVVECSLNPLYPVYVGVDFNVDMMSATYIQHINGVFYQCKEVQLTHRNANTHDLGQKIIQDLQGYQIHIVADSTGKARKTSSSSGTSDHQILKDMGLHLLETSNPLIRNRQNTVNLAFLKKQLVIDPSCTLTIKEIETLSSRDKEGSVSHLSVCLGYVMWKLAPLQPKVKTSHTIHL